VNDPFNARNTIETDKGPVSIYRLDALEHAGLGDVARLPYSIKVLLESALRNLDGFSVTEEHVKALARWHALDGGDHEIPFKPARVILQDFTGVPVVVDLAALRSAMTRLGGDPSRINPHVPVDLVIDHSVQVDAFGSVSALLKNTEREFERNRERYEFLRWGQQTFGGFRVVPPGNGIVHQVNLEHLASVVQTRDANGGTVAFPDTVVGTDSHTTMINGLGVVGWGVGGIEAEAVMLGQPMYMVMPSVVGMRLTGQLPDGATATDLVLTITQLLRRHGVVGKFVEYFGEGVARLSLPDRATLANMAPEYGATMGFFPVDAEALRYLESTGRGASVDLVESYCRAQGLYRDEESPDPRFSDVVELDMSEIVPSIAGPRRPQERIALADAKGAFWRSVRDDFGGAPDPAGLDSKYTAWLGGDGTPGPTERLSARRDLHAAKRTMVPLTDTETEITDGVVVIAAITSCTNTSNPSVMIGAGLLAKRAVELGLDSKPWVKTTLAPGSRVVTRYLERATLTPYLQALGFHVVGYGCTSCIGNSGPLAPAVANAITEGDIVAAAVLSGNRNFEGRVNPLTRANYLASPPLVVAYALAGTIDIDFATEPLGTDPNGLPVYLADIWPSQEEVAEALAASIDVEMFESEYSGVFDGNEQWNDISAAAGVNFDWQADSTYVREPTFFLDLTPEVPEATPIRGARVLALLGDSITTDHISPAGAIPPDSPAALYLQDHGVAPEDFNSFGSRRGNHEVMMRGTFANIRLRNLLAPGTEGGFTKHVPTADVMPIYDAAMLYRERNTPLVILAGSEYGTGSSRDWAAKGTILLGVRAVIAESYERIHRSNLVGMGVLPLQFADGQGWQQLGLTGQEAYDIDVPQPLEPGAAVAVTATADDGSVTQFEVTARVDSPVDVQYLQHGGILHAVLREMLAGGGSRA
jgi:aconitate hydratase